MVQLTLEQKTSGGKVSGGKGGKGKKGVVAVKRPHRFRRASSAKSRVADWAAGTVALREIRKFQKSTDLLVRRLLTKSP